MASDINKLDVVMFSILSNTLIPQQIALEFQLIFFTEIICNTINPRNFADKFHRGLFYRYLFVFQQQTHEKQSSFGLTLIFF